MSGKGYVEGEWYIHKTEDGDAIGIARHFTTPRGGWQGIDICRLPVPTEKKTHEEIERNARIIVAAPKMLEALRAVDAMLSAPSTINQRSVAESVRAAIAKATQS